MSEEEIIESVKYHILLEYLGFCNIDKASLQGLLDLYNKEKEKNKQLEKIIRIIRNKLSCKVIIEENGIYKPCKNLSKQEVYKDYEEINDLLKANYCIDNETAIKEILKENGVN